MNEVPQKKLNVIGIIVTVAVSAGFIWAAMQWFNRDTGRSISVQGIQADEIRAFENLQMISRAQKKYKETDWDNDGNKVYAMYFVHLWSSVSLKSEPIRVNLIPKTLAFAMEAAKAVDGYYFVDLHERTSGNPSVNTPLDYQKQWAIMGLPVSYGQTGMLNFLADQAGSIYINNAKYVAPFYPENPALSGWTKIDEIEQLKDFQKKIIYPKDDLQQ